MAIFERRAVMPVSAEEVFAWHARAGAFERLNPSFDPVEVEERTGGLAVGARTVIRMSVGPVKQRWVAEHTAYEPGRMFRDEQKEGPFSKWVHTHLFEPRADGTCELVDRIEYELPLGAMGRLVGEKFTTDTLERTFAYRQALTHADLLRHRAFANRAPLRIAVTGSSGLVASALIPFLSAGGHTVAAVKRSANGFDASAFDAADVVINLAGAGVADERWSDERKALLRDSRIAYTAKLFDAIAARGAKPKVWLQGSAVGVYGTRGDEVLSDRQPLALPPREGDRRAADFLSDLCVDWEAAANPATQRFGSRVVALRIGIVQSARGGALAKMLPAFKMGVGGPLAGGKSWQACIALEDLLGQILFSIMNEGLSGAVNCVGPAPTTSLEYAKVLGKVLRRPAIAPLPAFALRTMFGELADGALLASQRAVPDRLTDAGFQFWQPSLEDALRFTLGK